MRALIHKLRTCDHAGPVDLLTTYSTRDEHSLRRQWCRDCGATRMVVGYSLVAETVAMWEFPQWVQHIREGQEQE